MIILDLGELFLWINNVYSYLIRWVIICKFLVVYCILFLVIFYILLENFCDENYGVVDDELFFKRNMVDCDMYYYLCF